MSDGLVLKFSLRDMGMGRTIQEVADRIERPQRMLSEIRLVMLSSIKRNFQEGGRPVPLEAFGTRHCTARPDPGGHQAA